MILDDLGRPNIIRRALISGMQETRRGVNETEMREWGLNMLCAALEDGGKVQKP